MGKPRPREVVIRCSWPKGIQAKVSEPGFNAFTDFTSLLLTLSVRPRQITNTASSGAHNEGEAETSCEVRKDSEPSQVLVPPPGQN